MGEMRVDALVGYSQAPKLRPLPGKNERYQLVEPYWVQRANTPRFLIHAGYCFDGASIPSVIGLTWAVTYSKFHPKVMRAALVHDWLCDDRPAWSTSRVAADIFQQMLYEDGASRKKAALMVRAVRWFGPKWDKTDAE